MHAGTCIIHPISCIRLGCTNARVGRGRELREEGRVVGLGEVVVAGMRPLSMGSVDGAKRLHSAWHHPSSISTSAAAPALSSRSY